MENLNHKYSLALKNILKIGVTATDEENTAVMMYNIAHDALVKKETMLSGGVYGSIEHRNDHWYGKILGISDLITYEAETRGELHRNFCKAVNEWHMERVGSRIIDKDA